MKRLEGRILIPASQWRQGGKKGFYAVGEDGPWIETKEHFDNYINNNMNQSVVLIRYSGGPVDIDIGIFKTQTELKKGPLKFFKSVKIGGEK